METKQNSFFAFLWSKLGWCPVCMRKAFLAAAALWATAFALLSYLQSSMVAGVATALAALATMLWVAHLLVYAAKTVSNESVAAKFDSSRRQSFPRFFTIFVVAAAASAIPQLALADQCGGTSGCSSKTCQGKKDKCTAGTNGCKCVTPD